MKKFVSLLISTILVLSSLTFVNGAEVMVYGDADNNKVLDVRDAVCLLQKVLVNNPMPIEENTDYMKYMDLNGDGVLSSADVAEILQMVINSQYRPVVVPETTTEVTTETTTEVTTQATTEVTTQATTEVTTQATTETTETTTQTYDEGVIASDYDLTPAKLAGNPYFVQDGDFTASDDTRIRLSGTNSLKFTVAKGANIYITARHASSTTSGTRTVLIKDAKGKTVASKGYEMGAEYVEYLYATSLEGTYTISSDNHINVADIRITFDNIEITTETTTIHQIIDVPTELETTGNAVYVSNFKDLQSAVSGKNVDIYVQNDISCSAQLKLSNSNAKVNIIGVVQPDGTLPSLDFAPLRDSRTSAGSGGTGFSMSGSHYGFENLIIENAGDCGIRISGSGSGYSIFKNCIFRYNNNSGVSITKKGSNNTFICVDSYRNGDLVQKNGADADGFSVKLAAGMDNYFYNCRAWENSDDGWDSYDRASDGGYIGDVYYVECLAWNNGNPYVFTGEYDYNHGDPLDKKLVYVQEILRQYPDFEAQYNAHTVTSWPKVTVKLLGTSNNYDNIHSKNWSGNPNGFKFGSAETPSSSYRYIENCIAFDHENTPNQTPAKGFDQNNGSAKYDIINGLSFNNGQNYWMDKMTALSMEGVFYGFNGGQDDLPGDLNITTPDAAKQTELENKVYQYRDMIYDYVYNDKTPGEQICNVF